MKKSKFKKIIILVFIAVVVIFAYNLFRAFTTGKQILSITTSREFSTNSNIEAVVSVKDKETKQSIKSNIKVELRDDKNKKVKNFKQTYKIEEGENATVSVPLPKNIEQGKYTLKFTSNSGIKKDTEEIDISITDKSSSDVIISLDKGIYKPGDEVNFRALLISKKDDTPKQEDVEVSIFDANDNRVYINKTKTSEFGIVYGKFTLAKEVNSGEYKISVSSKNVKTSKMFTVNPYTVPTFEVTLNTENETYKLNETATISVNSKYFFGEPVTNATVTGTINDKEFSGLTNENGIFEYPYELKETGKYDIDIQVVDSSNYLIEASKSIYASNNPFELEIFPEHGNLIQGVENKIYFITKKIDATPVKTYIEVNVGDLSKQVVTDEAGIGILTLNSDEISRLDYNAEISASASDLSGENSSSIFDVTIEPYKGTVVSLDKLKYKQNEDITLNLKSSTDVTNKQIFIYKNNNLLKIVSTDKDEVTVNLGDTYGLIDIYTKNNLRRNYFWDDYLESYDSNYTKKTIFITPEKALNINIETDKEEYKPGDKVNLSIKTTNENNENVEAGVLVSILDEAILSLADNDLSIDNIKLALSDIELSDEITMADLYAEILDETAENKLRVALLKQENGNPNIVQSSTSYYNKARQEYIVRAVLSGAITLFMICMYIGRKTTKFNKVLIAIINILALYLVCYGTLYELLYYEFDLSEIFTWVIPGIITLILYALVLYKLSNWIFNAITDLVLLPAIYMFITNLIASKFDYFDRSIVFVIAIFIPAIIMTILVVLARKFKLNNFWNTIKNLAIKLTIIEVVYVLSFLLSGIFSIDAFPVIIIIILIIYWLAQKVYSGGKTTEEKKTVIEITNSSTVLFISIALILGLIGIIYLYNSSTNNIVPAAAQISFEDIDRTDIAFNESISEGATSKGDSFLDGFATFSSDVKSSEVEESKVEESAETEKIENNVRKVFLESLAFIPEVVTTNGEAKTTIDLSDNITTWNIQTVGNTKDGRLGHNSSNFKVFKKFFIDFTLPTNSVVTDKTNIPITIYNYTDGELSVNLKVKENNWASIGTYQTNVTLLSNSTQMIYVPVELLKSGEQTLRIEANANGVSDIVEKTFTVSTNGLKKTKVVSSGTAEKKLELDHFTTEEAIENTRKLNVKLYPSIISQTVEGMENILSMPNGCFEQTSSSLYPDILALKYLEDTGLDAPEIKEKALDYISQGYQKLLTYETDTVGGYSLYGDNPAENVITAFGLMEFTDLKEVYDIDEKVTNNMIEYLFSEQNLDGTFDINSTYIGSASSTDDLAMNAYIIWALSEACPEDKRIEKSIEYLEDKLSDAKDSYTIALMANAFSNVESDSTKKAIDKLMEKVKEDDEGGAYIPSEVKDYWGTSGRYQNIQATALASMVLTKEKAHNTTNKTFLQYIVSHKDSFGTWSTTQATILALKAINIANSNGSLSNQKITASVNGNEKIIEIGDNPLDLYEVTFDKIENENKISLNIPKGNAYYEIIEEYYVNYSTLDSIENSQIAVTQTIDQEVKVNDIIHQNITVTNLINDEIRNGLVQISIPQGCSVVEESLAKLEYQSLIEKYEYNYNTINLYLRNFKDKANINLNLEYRANYPEQITGAMIRVFDYYNPSNEGFAMPVNIIVTE